jgi:mRNA interferase YafQ
MLQIKQTSAFKKDTKRAKKQRKDLEKLKQAVLLLTTEQMLPEEYRSHALIGNWKPCWECHLEPDWLLIYFINEEHLELIRLGSHSELFKK